MGDEFLPKRVNTGSIGDAEDAYEEGGRQEVLDEPELDTAVRMAKDAEDHDRRKTLFEGVNTLRATYVRWNIPHKGGQMQL